MDILRRESAPLSDRTWHEIDEAAKMMGRHMMSARRVATFDGPRGWEHIASPLGTMSPCVPQAAGATVCVPDVVLLSQIRADFSLPWSAIEVYERGGPALETGPAENAARDVALAEDRIALYGDPVGSGYLTQRDSPTVNLHDWSDGRAVIGDLVAAVAALDQRAIAGPYEVLLSPARYFAFQQAHDAGYPVSRHVKQFVAGVHRSAVIPDGGAVFSLRGEDFILTVGGDLSVGYRYHDQEAVHLFCLETITAQTIAADAVCLLK